MFTESLPSGRVRGGYRSPSTGRKITRTHDYAHEAEQWASESEERARACQMLGLEHDDDGRPLLAPAPAGDAPSAANVSLIVEQIPSSTPTFASYARQWLAAREGSLAHGTIKGYRFHVSKLGVEEFARIPIGDLRRSDVETWRTQARGRGVGTPTLNARLKVIRMVCRWAVADRLIEHDPTEPIGFLPTAKRAERVLDEAEEIRLLDACSTPEERLCVLLGLDAGLRWGEVAGIPTDAIIVRDGKRYVDVRQVVERSSGLVRPYTKDHGRRLVPVTTDRLWDAWTAVVGERGRFTPGALVFTARSGKPLGYDNWRHRDWKGLTHRAGINARGGARFRFHDLRHTCGTLLAEAGVPRGEIAAFLGHSDEKTTARYVHARTDGRRHDLAASALSRRSRKSAESGGSVPVSSLAV
jgi:integrase